MTEWKRKAMRGVEQVTITPSIDCGEMYRWEATINDAANATRQCLIDTCAAELERELWETAPE